MDPKLCVVHVVLVIEVGTMQPQSELLMASTAAPMKAVVSQQILCVDLGHTEEAALRVNGCANGATVVKAMDSVERVLGQMDQRLCAVCVALGSEQGTHHLQSGTKTENISVRGAPANMKPSEGWQVIEGFAMEAPGRASGVVQALRKQREKVLDRMDPKLCVVHVVLVIEVGTMQPQSELLMASTAAPMKAVVSQQILCVDLGHTEEAALRVNGCANGATVVKAMDSVERVLGQMDQRLCAVCVALGSEQGTHHLQSGTKTENISVRGATASLIPSEGWQVIGGFVMEEPGRASGVHVHQNKLERWLKKGMAG